MSKEEVLLSRARIARWKIWLRHPSTRLQRMGIVDDVLYRASFIYWVKAGDKILSDPRGLPKADAWIDASKRLKMKASSA